MKLSNKLVGSMLIQWFSLVHGIGGKVGPSKTLLILFLKAKAARYFQIVALIAF